MAEDVVPAPARGMIRAGAKRLLDIAVSFALLLVLLPLLAVVAVAVKLESRGPVFYFCPRVGYRWRELRVPKFRKMHDRATGSALTRADDERFTRIGRILAATKLDELPQLWSVLRGEMGLVGPRPEDPRFVALHRGDYQHILAVKPGITGLTQIAFAREGEILDPEDAERHYVERLLPQKVGLDRLYASRSSIGLDLRVLWWTAMATVFRRQVAVHRSTGRMNLRRRPRAVHPDATHASPSGFR